MEFYSCDASAQASSVMTTIPLQPLNLNWGNDPKKSGLQSGLHFVSHFAKCSPQVTWALSLPQKPFLGIGVGINALRFGSWALMGWLMCGLFCLAHDSFAAIQTPRSATLPNPGAEARSDAADGRIIVEIPAPSLERIVYLSGLLLLLSAMLAWQCRIARNEQTLQAVGPSVLDREQRSPELVSLVRKTLMPKFMQWLKTDAVEKIMAQREKLLDTQHLAEMELAKLEQALMLIQAPLQERLRQYEQRIADLEEALRVKGHESRELIETMIRLTRQKLDTEREASAEAMRS